MEGRQSTFFDELLNVRGRVHVPVESDPETELPTLGAVAQEELRRTAVKERRLIGDPE